MKSYEKALKTKKQFIDKNDSVNLKRLENQVKNAIEELKKDTTLLDSFKNEYIKGFQKVLDYSI